MPSHKLRGIFVWAVAFPSYLATKILRRDLRSRPVSGALSDWVEIGESEAQKPTAKAPGVVSKSGSLNKLS